LTDAATAGGELRRAREERGLTLGDVAQQLKFSLRQLEALEQDRYGELPGVTFARGMVRSYARLLKVDPEPLLGRIAERFGAPDSNELAERYRQPVPFSDNARLSTLVYVGLSLGILVLVGGVAYQWYHERNAKPQMAFVSAARAPIDAPAEPAPPAPAPPPAPEKISNAAPLPPTPKAAAASPAPAGAAPKVVPAGIQRIVISFDEEAWIEVRNAEDRLFVSSLNPAGSERVVQGRGPFTLVIGNSRYVRVTLNGQPVDLQRYAKYGKVARLKLP
jgi:cytoskeleton protein RodZ